MQKNQPLVGKYIFSIASKEYSSLRAFEQASKFMAEIVASVYDPENLKVMETCFFVKGSDHLKAWQPTKGVPEDLKMIHVSYVVCADTELNRELL